jgi:hypothetical protein
MPVILASQEAEIRRTEVQSQPGEKSLRNPVLKKAHQKRAGRMAQSVGQEFKPQCHKKKKKKKRQISELK